MEGSCEHSNERSGCIKCWECLEWISDWRLLKDDSAASSYKPIYVTLLYFKGKVVPVRN
jgi:hypothetical protein